MYVVTAGHHEILGFGLTPEQAKADASDVISRLPPQDNRPREVHPCSPDLYRKLQVERELYDSLSSVGFRLVNGLAVPFPHVTAAAIDDYVQRLRVGAERADDPSTSKYVIVAGDEVCGFGPTPEWGWVDAKRRILGLDISCSGPCDLDVYPCSAELYVRLKAQPARRYPVLLCRLVDGVAVSVRRTRVAEPTTVPLPRTKGALSRTRGAKKGHRMNPNRK